MPAPSNHVRVGEAIVILAKVLGPWITQVLQGRIPANTTWPELLEAKDGYPRERSRHHGTPKGQRAHVTLKLSGKGIASGRESGTEHSSHTHRSF